jgi:hypothetical protein
MTIGTFPSGSLRGLAYRRRGAAGIEHVVQRPLAIRREQHDARIPGALRPPKIDKTCEQRRAQCAGQVMTAFAPIEARCSARLS